VYVILYNSGVKKFETDKTRPGSHLNVGTLRRIVKDIIANTPLVQPEADLLLYCDPKGKKNVVKIVRKMKKDNFLSTKGYAVCHKIPFAAVQRATVALLNQKLDKRAQKVAGQPKLITLSPAWANLELLTQELFGHGYATHAASMIMALKAVDTTNAAVCSNAADVANTLLVEFDAASDNLFVGFAQTNSSVSDQGDYHFDILNTPSSTAAIDATPRGVDLLTRLNTLETALGITPTRPEEVVDINGDNWTKTSSEAGIGWVVSL
jgi:hypothetical protein